MSLFDGFFAGLGDFASTVGDIATDLQPVADLYGSVTGGGAPAYDLGSSLPSLGGGGGFTPGFVPAGTGTGSYQGPTPSGEPLGSSSSGVVLLGVGLLVLFLLSRR